MPVPASMSSLRITECPKCHYHRQPEDRQVHPALCPRCGIAYQKWLDRQQGTTPACTPASTPAKSTMPHHTDAKPEPNIQEHTDTTPSFARQLRAHLLWVPATTDPVSFWGRVILLAAFTLWGGFFISAGVDWETIGGSFMHNVNLPFHEFGHVLFMPFGRFMAILGGSLFQVLMPLGLMLAFSIQRRDNFAASIMLWWSGQSFIDIAPYIADAPYRAIPLIRGMSEDAHDWGNLLSMTGNLNNASAIAHISFGIGALLIAVASGWGARVLQLQKQRPATTLWN